MVKALRQIFETSLPDLINTILSYFMFFSRLFNPSFLSVIGCGISSMIGLISSKKWRVCSGKAIKNITFKYYLAYFFTWLLGNYFTNFAIGYCHLNGFLVPIANLILIIPINWLLSKYWIFQRKEVNNNANNQKR